MLSSVVEMEVSGILLFAHVFFCIICFKSIYDRILYFGVDSIIEYRCSKLNYGNYDWYLD